MYDKYILNVNLGQCLLDFIAFFQIMLKWLAKFHLSKSTLTRELAKSMLYGTSKTYLWKNLQKIQSILLNKDLEWKGNKPSFHVPTKDPYFGIFSASEAKTSLGYSTCLTAIYVQCSHSYKSS